MRKTALKRTPFKRKVTKPMKRAKLAKKGKSSISRIQAKLWDHCKRIIRKRYGNTCYTCGKTGLEGSNWHTGHFIAKASLGAYLKYDLRLLRPQCYHCNINLGGNGAVFYALMVHDEGQEYVDRIFVDRCKTVKASDHYALLLEEYANLDG